MHEDISHFPHVGELTPLRVELAGVSYCDGTYRIRRRDSGINVLEYVTKGSGRLHVGNQEFNPRGGDVYITHEGTDHEYWSDADNPWGKIWFNVSGSLCGALLRCYGLGRVWHVPGCEVGALFSEALAAMRAEPEQADALGAQHIHRIIAAIAGRMAGRESRILPGEDGARMREHIERRLPEEVSLEELGRLIGRSRSQVIRIFRRDFNTTPVRYALERRLELASRYLRNTAKPIKEIADELNFADEYHFSNMFRRHIGIAPGAYRRGDTRRKQ